MLLLRGFKQSLGLLILAGAVGLLPSQAIAQFSVTAPTVVARTDTTATAIRRLEQSKQRWIEIKLSSQRLIAWEGKAPVYAILISTGKASTPTRTGVFAIQTRDRYARMRGDDYDIADVPYTMYYSGSYAIHGAYWHRRFGTPVSHGCVNLAVDHARWLFNWARIGTSVVVRR
ncbi:MAG: L,D-transpeptidase [Tildeniella nuda ZEHNDER 1965/U140]|jgi:lipoprotein-anchoring transpeptidase ErfK/SrfK|nr:L,D-transpeptidase [Tildeniella nuda ZEHNDER 1965/U140]